MENIYFNCVLTKKIIVEAKYLNENIDNYIESYLKKKIEGTCIDEGYIKPDTIKILKKSVGKLLGSRFTGDITYEIAYTASICNPVLGNVIDCKVKFVNKLGILGNNGPITIIVGKQFHMNDDEINKISENDIIKVEVIAKKFYLNDKEIKIIAKLWNPNELKQNNNSYDKKELISSDLTPILDDNYENEDMNNGGEDAEDIEDAEDTEDEEDEEDVEDAEDAEDAEDPEDDVQDFDDIQVENPDENNLDIEDIEIDEDTEEYDDPEDVYTNDYE